MLLHEGEELIQEQLLLWMGEPAALTADLHAAHHVLLQEEDAEGGFHFWSSTASLNCPECKDWCGMSKRHRNRSGSLSVVYTSSVSLLPNVQTETFPRFFFSVGVSSVAQEFPTGTAGGADSF